MDNPRLFTIVAAALLIIKNAKTSQAKLQTQIIFKVKLED
jgi:hypothetical protein